MSVEELAAYLAEQGLSSVNNEARPALTGRAQRSANRPPKSRFANRGRPSVARMTYRVCCELSHSRRVPPIPGAGD